MPLRFAWMTYNRIVSLESFNKHPDCIAPREVLTSKCTNAWTENGYIRNSPCNSYKNKGQALYGHLHGGVASEAFAWGQCLHKRKHHVCLLTHHHTSSRCGSQRTWENSAENLKCVLFMSVALPRCAVWNKSVLVHKLFFISMQKQMISAYLPVDGMCCAFCFCFFVCVCVFG